MATAKKDQAKDQTKEEKKETTFEQAPKEGGSSEVQSKMDEAKEKGFFGKKVDPVDNFEYTLAGVTQDK